MKNSTVLFYFAGLFGLLLFGYFISFGEGHFFVQEKKTLFIFSGEYFSSFACKPGGMLEYAGAFLTQGYQSVLYGSFLLAALFLLFFASSFSAAKLLTGKKNVPPVPVLLSLFLFLVILVREDQLLCNSLGFLLVVVCFRLLITLIEKRLPGIILICFPFLFYLSGSFSFLFVIMIVAFSMFSLKGKQRFLYPILLFMSVVCTFFIFREIIFLQPTELLLGYPLTFSKFPEILLTGYMMIFPVILKAGLKRKEERKSSGALTIVILILLFACAVLYLRMQYDPERRKELILEKLYIDQKWDEVIRIHEKYHSENAAGQYFFNLALLEKDELCNRMFTCRQDYHGELLSLPRTKENLNKAFHFYYAIGMINEAYHLAYESMVIYGYQAENLKMLVKTDLINGNYAIAERHINILKKTLLYRKWAFRYEKMLYNPSIVLSDVDLGRKVKLRPHFDFFLSPDDRDNLDMLLIANPDNTKAFECRMAWFLLDKEYKNVVYYVKRLSEMGYQKIPRHIEEALMIFENQKYELPYLGGFIVSEDTRSRYKLYLSDRVKNGAVDKEKFIQVSAPQWDDTFWYYFYNN